MNTNKTRVLTRFAPETRFELRPAPTAPFRAVQETEFERLKNKLLAEQLAEVVPELNVPLRRAAGRTPGAHLRQQPRTRCRMKTRMTKPASCSSSSSSSKK